MENLKTTIITALLMLAMVSGAVAQEKWEYAVVQYFYAPKNLITVSINGEKYEEVEVGKNSLQGKIWGYDLSPPLKKINELQGQGWELYDNETEPNLYIFYLRKKK